MESFSILNSRKRAVLALIHSILFLAVAGVQAAVSHVEPFNLRAARPASGVVLLAIYVIVSVVLLLMLGASRCTKEKLYFGLCAASASFGLLRILMGDQVLHVNAMRVAFLACAVLVGLVILRTHSAPPQVQPEQA